MVTSARWVNGGLEVRMFNPTSAPGDVRVRFGNNLGFASMQAVDSESNPLAEARSLSETDGVIHLLAKQIQTIRFA